MYRMFLSAHKSLAHLGARHSFRSLGSHASSPVDQFRRFNSDNRSNEDHENMRASFDKTADGFETIGESLENLAEQVRQMGSEFNLAKQEIASHNEQIKQQAGNVKAIKGDIISNDEQIKEHIAVVETIKRDIASHDEKIMEQAVALKTAKKDIDLQGEEIISQAEVLKIVKKDTALQGEEIAKQVTAVKAVKKVIDAHSEAIAEQTTAVNTWEKQLKELKSNAIILGGIFIAATAIGGGIFRWWAGEEFSKVMKKVEETQNQLAKTQSQLNEAKQENDRLLKESAEAYQKQLAEASDIYQTHLAESADAHQAQLAEAEKKIDTLRGKITDIHDEASSVHTQISNMNDNAQNYFSAFEKNYGVSPESIKKQIADATEQAKNEIVKERDRTLEAVQEINPLTFKDALLASIENEALRVQAKWNSSFSSYRIVGFFGLSRGSAHQYKLCALEALRAEIMNSKESVFKCSPETKNLLNEVYDYWPEEEDKRFKQNFIEVHLKNNAESLKLTLGQ